MRRSGPCGIGVRWIRLLACEPEGTDGGTCPGVRVTKRSVVDTRVDWFVDLSVDLFHLYNNLRMDFSINLQISEFITGNAYATRYNLIHYDRVRQGMIGIWVHRYNSLFATNRLQYCQPSTADHMLP